MTSAPAMASHHFRRQEFFGTDSVISFALPTTPADVFEDAISLVPNPDPAIPTTVVVVSDLLSSSM